MKLSDLEICEQVAKIEGFTLEQQQYICKTPYYSFTKDCPLGSAYAGVSFTLKTNNSSDPSVMNALCFHLIQKYRLEIETNPTHFQVYYMLARGIIDESLQRAVCLALIAKYEFTQK